MPSRVVKSYKVLIGLEIHVQLATRSKMFAACANGATNFGADPNSLVDEVVLGLPGVLPVLNKRAVEYAILMGLAMGCEIAPHTKWDRKSYFYPDLPKNYQISQYDLPLCGAGTFQITTDDGQARRIRIRRAHLEEDAGKLLHDAPGGFKIDHSIVDLNRAGTPLLEIVTEPDLASPREVAIFAQELQKLVRFLGISEGQMQKGHMRFEPNINAHITDSEGQVHKTAITEVKNLNSFSVLERATAYEIQRQIHAWLDSGSLGTKSTYGWDESREQTFHQRDKEEATDYRYFPDPDLPDVEVSQNWLDELKAQVGELPAARRERYIQSLGLSAADANTLLSDRATGDYFEKALTAAAGSRRIAPLILSHARRLCNERACALNELGILPERIAEIAGLIDANKIAPGSAGAIFDALIKEDAPAEQLARTLGLIQTSDAGAVDAAIEALIAANPPALADFKNGKQAALGALVGMIMKSSKGLNPKLVQQRLRDKLSST